jgi:peptide/nickel transport system permease protein
VAAADPVTPAPPTPTSEWRLLPDTPGVSRRNSPPGWNGRGRGNGRLALGAVLVGVVLAAALLGPLLWRQDPLAQDLSAILARPDAAHPLGTDQLGRDTLARVLAGGRTSLVLTVPATVLATLLGLLAAVAAVARRGVLDPVVGRVADVQLAIPSLLVAIVVVVLTERGTGPLLAVLVLSSWVLPFRLLRTALTQVLAQPYVEAAQVSGLPWRRVLRRHLLPAVLPHVVVVGTLTFGAVLMLSTSLGFLGVGVRPPTPEWGRLVAEGQSQLGTAWWISFAPGAALVLLLVGTQLLGDWCADRYSLRGIVGRTA